MSKQFIPVFGKNVIESLTTGMYDAPFFIYREYIQNAADAIDLAVRSKLFHERNEGQIKISINKKDRQLIIEDNATGIPTKNVQSFLGNIAYSTKERNVDKGFRGIGRLGGLGYCDRLTYETSFKGERIKSVMIWDAKSLRVILNDQASKLDAAQLISIITDFSRLKEDLNSHYFKVTLDNVNTEELLDESEVLKYLSMVAPVPFRPTFTFSEKIYERAKNDGIKIDEYSLYLNESQIYKAYKNTIFNNGKAVDEIIDVEFIKDYFFENELLFWGWYGITTKMRYLPDENYERFLRLRKHNIQIGLESRLDKFHKKDTGNRYYIGEIYGVHKDLQPNARRDFFIENSAETAFSSKLRDKFEDLYTLFYDFSVKNSAVKIIEKTNSLQSQLDNKLAEGADDALIANLSIKLNESRAKASEAKQNLIVLESKYHEKALAKLIKKIEADAHKNGVDTEIHNDTSQSLFRLGKKLTEEETNLLSSVYKVIRLNKNKKGEDLIKVIEKSLVNKKSE